MILTSAAGATQRLTDETAAKLREADRVERYTECGWHCAAGFIGDGVHVAVHAKSSGELDLALRIAPTRKLMGF